MSRGRKPCDDRYREIMNHFDDALIKWKEYVSARPRRMSVADRERAAYLQGVFHGLSKAIRAFEMKSPTELYGSCSSPFDTEPLGEEFESILDENADALYVRD